MKKVIMTLAISVAFVAGHAHATDNESTEYTSNTNSAQTDSALTPFAPETGEQSTAEDGVFKKWGVSLAFTRPVTKKLNWKDKNHTEFDFIAKRFIGTGSQYLTFPIEIETSFFMIHGEYESRHSKGYTEYKKSFFDLSNNILARFIPLSFFYVEGGIQWGYNFQPYSSFTLGAPVGFGFIIPPFEIGARATFGLTDYDSIIGGVNHYHFFAISVIF